MNRCREPPRVQRDRKLRLESPGARWIDLAQECVPLDKLIPDLERAKRRGLRRRRPGSLELSRLFV